MSEEKTQAKPDEGSERPAPESPGIVKKAADTVARPKVKPSEKTASASQPKPASEKAQEKAPEKPAESSGNALSIFGWDL